MDFLKTLFAQKPQLTTAELVEQIHTEFNTAGDRLLEQAQALLADSSMAFKTDKAQRLSKYGFGNTQEAKQSAALASEAAQAKELQDLIMDYALRYPTNRFITRAQVDVIAAKYNLVVGPTTAYTGFVPDVKLREVEVFMQRFKKDDSPALLYIRVTKWGFRNMYEREIKVINQRYPDGLIPIEATNIGRYIDEKRSGEYWLDNGMELWCVYSSLGSPVRVEQYERINTSAQLIAAPAKDMQLEGLKKVKGHFFNFTTHEVPDPVVLQPVKGGYLIVAAWGDEASDPLVANSQNN